MFARLNTKASRAFTWRRQNASRLALEGPLRRKVNAILKDAAKTAQAVYARSGNEGAAVSASAEIQSQLRPVLEESALTSSLAFARMLLDSAKQAGRVRETKASAARLLPDARREERTPEEQRVLDKLSQNARSRTATKITSINKTTEKRIRKAISDGIEKGLSQSEIADAILLKTGGSIAEYRAEVIARTEVHANANYGAVETAEIMGVADKKEWLATEDDRTREDHQEADGQEVPLKEDFEVGGEGLAFPGDPRGSGEQVINCRCALLFH